MVRKPLLTGSSSRPPVASLIGWDVAMTIRQSGHFLFEPPGHDHRRQMMHEHKQSIKVGYNLPRKVLHAVQAVVPIALW